MEAIMKRIHLTFIVIVLAMIIMICQTEIFAATGSVNVAETHQTIEGFGASIGFYEGILTNHPNKDDIYDYMFQELGLDILRLRNSYRNNPANFNPDVEEIVQNMYYHSDFEPKILISSWSPPADLKSNNNVNGGNNATLKKENDEFVYGKFAKYWTDALDAFNNIGIVPDYISLQNELSYDAEWESCRFDPTETTSIAGYDHALDSVYTALQQAGISTKILGPECHGIGYQTFQHYAARFNHDLLYGYAYHLYHGGDGNVHPDAFNANLTAIANNYSDKPIFQTEYDYGGWFNTAWLMHDCLVNGNVSGYLYWELIWPYSTTSNAALIPVENQYDPGGWTTNDGYVLSQNYWAFRQFSKFIFAGWKRVTADADDDSLKISAYINPENDMLTVVIINVSHEDNTLSFNIQGFDIENGEIIRTSETEQGDFISYLDGSSSLEIPARSITTLSCWGETTGIAETRPLSPDRFVLGQNYPNPFNAFTTIDYSTPFQSAVQMNVYNTAGQKVKTWNSKAVPPGTHTIHLNAEDLPSGVYFYRIRAGETSQLKKMILIK